MLGLVCVFSGRLHPEKFPHLRISARVYDEHIRIIFVDFKDIGTLRQAYIGRLVRKFKVKKEKFQSLLHRSLGPVQIKEDG